MEAIELSSDEQEWVEVDREEVNRQTVAKSSTGVPQ
jgi:hypothetical protein